MFSNLLARHMTNYCRYPIGTQKCSYLIDILEKLKLVYRELKVMKLNLALVE